MSQYASKKEREAYEAKLSEKSESVAVVEEDKKEKLDLVEQKDGSITMGKSLYENFNKELRERVR